MEAKDENVFDIQQGVAIVLFIKKEKREEECRVLSCRTFTGLRESQISVAAAK